MQPLTIALGNYGLTKPIKQAGFDLGRLDLKFVEVEQIVPMMRRMCRGLEFDICEMAFTTYVCARAAGLPFTAIPLFVTRNFHHWAIFHNVNSGIRTPKDLEGRKVGVNRGYTVTTGLWARGILQSEYGVDLNKVTWVPTDDEHVLGFEYPPNVDYQPPRQADAGAAAVRRGRRRARRGRRRSARDQAAHSRRPQRRVRLFPQDRHLPDQSRRGRQELGAQGQSRDRRRAHPRVRGGQGGVSEEPAGQRDQHRGTRPRPSTPRWSAIRSRSASRRTARRWRRSRNSRSTRRWCRGSIRSKSCLCR